MSYEIEFNLVVECIDKHELLKRMNGKANFVLVDTVGKYNGNRFKIKGARTIPYPEVIDRRGELMSYDEIVIYCKNKDCKASKKVAMGLKLLNVPNVKVYEGGIDEWRDNNLPVEDE
ncbi:MAG: rhodanese-like domain-containing protein [Thermodesulfovibrionia bacterium]|nr:rhodanese-like domain-containing protein [Thermodesulfovibrionia bacterium]